MSRGKRITSETIEKIMAMSNAGMKAGQISKILNGISVRSINAYIDCVRAAERNESELYSSKMVGKKEIQKYCDAHGLIAPAVTYFKKKEEVEQMRIGDAYQPSGSADNHPLDCETIYVAIGEIIRSLVSIRDVLIGENCEQEYHSAR